MKILITTPGLRFGGAERVLSVLANQWVNAGHEVAFFLTVSKDLPVYDLDERVEVSYSEKNKRKTGIFSIISGIRSRAKSFKPDIALSFMQDVAALTAIALFGTGIPLIYSERNDPNKTNTRRIDGILRKIIEHRAKHFVFQTEGARACFKKSVQRKSRVILNPFDTNRFPIHDFSNEKDEIVAVGRLEEQKNYPLLFTSFAKIADEFPSIALCVYGDGSQRLPLERMIEELNLTDRILLKGQVTDISNHTKDAKVFVMTSDYEGLPNALMEALAMGLPAVSTDCSPGGARALIHNGTNGYIVECGDSDGIADKLRDLLSNRERAELFGQNALDLRSKIDSRVIASQWLSLFEETINRR